MSCNGCRVLRKGCSDKCVLRSSLHWIDSPEAQGNATLFLAKFFGRSDLISFISAVPDHQRPGAFLIFLITLFFFSFSFFAKRIINFNTFFFLFLDLCGSHFTALFQSLLFEACGRTVNPVNGAVGLLSSGNWHVCQTAVETVLSGGVLRPIAGILTQNVDESSETYTRNACMLPNLYYPSLPSIYNPKQGQPLDTDMSLSTNFGTGGRGRAWSFSVEKRLRDSVSVSSEESVITTGGLGIGERKERKLLNLFV